MNTVHDSNYIVNKIEEYTQQMELQHSKLFATPLEVLEWLSSRGLFHIELSLGRIRRALWHFGFNRSPFKALAQVLGTNGKGSTTTFLASIAQAHGVRVGLYQSPHFVSPSERILIQGQPICLETLESLPYLADEILKIAPSVTYFEFLTILALLIFADANLDIVILEAGLGGKNDATSALDADVLCYTPIAMDHANIIGPSISDIAEDKLAIIRQDQVVVSAKQVPIVTEKLENIAKNKQAILHYIEPLPASWQYGLHGLHQRTNAAIAIHAWRHLATKLEITPDPDLEHQGLAKAWLPGRLQFVSGKDWSKENLFAPPLLLDGAHNPHGMQALVKSLQDLELKPKMAIVACLKDREWQASLAMLIRQIGQIPIIALELNNERAVPQADLLTYLNKLTGNSATGATNLANALDLAQNLLTQKKQSAKSENRAKEPLLITGSLYLLAEFYKLYPQLLHNPNL